MVHQLWCGGRDSDPRKPYGYRILSPALLTRLRHPRRKSFLRQSNKTSAPFCGPCDRPHGTSCAFFPASFPAPHLPPMSLGSRGNWMLFLPTLKNAAHNGDSPPLVQPPMWKGANKRSRATSVYAATNLRICGIKGCRWSFIANFVLMQSWRVRQFLIVYLSMGCDGLLFSEMTEALVERGALA